MNRIVIAAASSSAGKTTIATGIMAALHQRGLVVQGFKVGPDYIDPGYHSLATGRPGRNLDPVLTSEELIVPLFRHGMSGAEIGVVEGVMGLFDGRLGGDGFGSTAHIARLLDAPVLVIVDGAKSSRTAAATLTGLQCFDPTIRIAGAIINRTASDRHAQELRRAVEKTGFPVLGQLPRNESLAAPSRHLGLVPAAERDESEALLTALTQQIAAGIDLDALLKIARFAPPLSAPTWKPEDVVEPVSGRPRIAVAGGRAFTFHYPETTELLSAAGCEVVTFDPLVDESLPEGTAGLYLGGGFPEVYAHQLGTNRALLAQIRTAVLAGLPTVAECAGLVYLSHSVDGQPLVGALESRAAMTPKLTLGYRTRVAARDSILAAAGTTVTGHEFHRTQIDRPGTPAWTGGDWPAEGFTLDPETTGTATLHASYLHLHWAGNPQLVSRFAAAAAAFPGCPGASGDPRPHATLDLNHHGDDDARLGSADALNLAVNVRLRRPPEWLTNRLATEFDTLGDYPDPRAARTALAARHGVPVEMVLPTAGAAEAFTLIAQALRPRTPVVVHPQFSEPEVALAAAGCPVQRVVLEPPFDLDPATIHSWADLVVIGNPTNPTGVLHPAETLKSLARDRILVIDEAFLDATDEAETLIAPEMPNILVIRSATKMWGLAGLRAGYLVGDPGLIAKLAAVQPHWSVSSLALAALESVAGRDPQAERAAIDTARAELVAALESHGFRVNPSAAPFVLVQTPWANAWDRLAARQVIVRRCDTFPGLDSSWIRIAVPTGPDLDRLLTALTEESEG